MTAEELSVRSLVDETLARAPRLRNLGTARRCAALAAAASMLADASTTHGRRAREVLPASCGLSRPMVSWALETSLAGMTAESLEQLAALPMRAGVRPVVPRLVALVLAGNVFTAAIRPIFEALAIGAAVVCKASSRDDAFPRLLATVLQEIDEELGGAFGVCSFEGGTIALEDALFDRADVVVVYGSDDTVAALRARVKPTARLIEHGHGFSAAYVAASALASREDAEIAAERLALDVAAYDQRGCLSPHVAFVQRGASISGSQFAALVDRALADIGERLPRGPIPRDVAAAQMQWRGTMAVLGDAWEGPAHYVVYAGDEVMRTGPGWRNLLILDCTGPENVAARLAPLGIHLKTIGVAGTRTDVQLMADAIAPPQSPRICTLGRMQTPRPQSFADGAPPLEGMLRWMQVEED